MEVERSKVKKLSDTLKATQDRLKVLKSVHEDKIDQLNAMKNEVGELQAELLETRNELEKAKQMNVNWQNTAMICDSFV